jgi:hypothetical protein
MALDGAYGYRGLWVFFGFVIFFLEIKYMAY